MEGQDSGGNGGVLGRKSENIRDTVLECGSVCVCMDLCICTCTHVCTSLYMCMCEYMCVCMCIRAYAYCWPAGALRKEHGFSSSNMSLSFCWEEAGACRRLFGASKRKRGPWAGRLGAVPPSHPLQACCVVCFSPAFLHAGRLPGADCHSQLFFSCHGIKCKKQPLIFVFSYLQTVMFGRKTNGDFWVERQPVTLE